MSAHQNSSELLQLKQGMIACFNEDELRTLAFDLNIDFEALYGSTKPVKVTSFIQHVERYGITTTLHQLVMDLRPLYPWQSIDSTLKTVSESITEAIDKTWGDVLHISASNDRAILSIVTADNYVRLWSIVDGRLVRSYTTDQALGTVSISHDSKYLVCATEHILGGDQVSIIDIKHQSVISKCWMGSLHKVSALHCEAQRVLIGMSDGSLFSMSYTGEQREFITKLDFGINFISANLNATNIALGSYDKGIQVINPQTNSEPIIVEVSGRTYGMSLHPDGNIIAYGNPKGDGVFIVDINTGVRVFRPHTDQVSCVAFSLAGSTLAAGDWDGGLYLYKKPTWNRIGATSAHPRVIRSIAFSASDSYLISGGGLDNPYFAIWDMNRMVLHARIPREPSAKRT